MRQATRSHTNRERERERERKSVGPLKKRVSEMI